MTEFLFRPENSGCIYEVAMSWVSIALILLDLEASYWGFGPLIFLQPQINK